MTFGQKRHRAAAGVWPRASPKRLEAACFERFIADIVRMGIAARLLAGNSQGNVGSMHARSSILRLLARL